LELLYDAALIPASAAKANNVITNVTVNFSAMMRIFSWNVVIVNLQVEFSEQFKHRAQGGCCY